MKKQIEINAYKSESKVFKRILENVAFITNLVNAKGRKYSNCSMIFKTLVIAITISSITACSNTKSKVVTGSIVIIPDIPTDIRTDYSCLNCDIVLEPNLEDAAIFAWQEFIALNWPAKAGFRDSADTTLRFGDPSDTALVWHTFRHKVEIYPGDGINPAGNATAPDYGYNAGPNYVYNDDSTNGPILPYPKSNSTTTPWINLDETNEIGVANMFAGVGDTTNNNNMMLYLAKANKKEYTYVVKNGWYSQTDSLTRAQQRTIKYIDSAKNTPHPDSDTTYVSFPYGTIEVKSAWRKLTPAEHSSKRFYTNTVRHYYVNLDSLAIFPKKVRYYYIDETYGMVALHIIQKTPSAPYFIFATFEQTDNILTTDGRPTEDSNGKYIGLNAFDPGFTVTNATAAGHPMIFTPNTKDNRLYYKNILADSSYKITNPLASFYQLPLVQIAINKRLYPISDTIQQVNKLAHKAITDYNPNAVWQYYKLISVQYKPINKPTPGEDYHGPDSSTYYQSNSVVESDYILQRFSGTFYTKITPNNDTLTPNSISDFKPCGDTAYNVYYRGQPYLMGGCMGCHGNAANNGSDFSFILGNSVTMPSPARQMPAIMAMQRLRLYFKKK